MKGVNRYLRFILLDISNTKITIDLNTILPIQHDDIRTGYIVLGHISYALLAMFNITIRWP